MIIRCNAFSLDLDASIDCYENSQVLSTTCLEAQATKVPGQHQVQRAGMAGMWLVAMPCLGGGHVAQGAEEADEDGRLDH